MLPIANVKDEDGPGWTYAGCGFDWRKVVDDGLIDALAVVSISSDPKDPFGYAERAFRRVVERVGGKCKVYFPIRAYNFSKSAPSYGQLAEWARVTPQESIRRLLDIAVRCGADGIVMECVDLEKDNYPDEDSRIIRDFNP